jgi:hypothetical protein
MLLNINNSFYLIVCTEACVVVYVRLDARSSVNAVVHAIVLVIVI